MLLTLSTRSLASLLKAEDGALSSLFDLPAFAIKQLMLHGLNVPASMLAGWSHTELDTLRDQADKAACPCLVLVEDKPLKLADANEGVRDAATDRIRRLAAGAHRLGCNALALACDAPDTEEAFDRLAGQLRAVMPAVERLELNVLLAPHNGLTAPPDRLTDFNQRIGGFRIGSLPSFEHAASTGEPLEALRKLAPYAGSIHATVLGFDKSGRHRGYDLAECVAAVRSVGFVNTLAIDYVGNSDPIEPIERARAILQAAIDDE